MDQLIVATALAFPAVVLLLGAAALGGLLGPARAVLQANTALARRRAELEGHRIEAEKRRLELEAAKLELDRQVAQLQREKVDRELEALRPRPALPPAEREAALAKVVRDAYLLAEQTAKNNKANNVVVTGAWKLGEALRLARELLALSPALEVTDRELALRLEVEVAENDPEGKHKQPKKPAPSSTEKRA